MIIISNSENVLHPTVWEIFKKNRELMDAALNSPLTKIAFDNQDVFKASIRFQDYIKNIQDSNLSNVLTPKAWHSFTTYQNILSDLNTALKSESIIDYIDVSEIKQDKLKCEESSVEELNDDFSEIEAEIVNTLSKDDKFIAWFRSKFPTFSKAPAEVIAKYFFCYILRRL